MHKMSKMFVFFRRKVLIYKNWTWIVFTFCKMKTLISYSFLELLITEENGLKASQAHTV